MNTIIATIDDLENNFETFLKSKIDSKYQKSIDELVEQFGVFFRDDPTFCIDNYPKLSGFIVTKLKKQSSFEKIKVLKTHIDSVHEYVENTKITPSSAVKTLKRLKKEYGTMLAPQQHWMGDSIVIDFLTKNNESVQYCFDHVDRELQKQMKDVPPQPLQFTRSFTGTERQNLFDGLVSGGFIPKDTNPAHFNFVFGGTETADFEPLQWQRSQSLLAYFIYYGFGDTDGTNLWKITQNTFTIKGKYPNDRSMATDVAKWKDKCDDASSKDKPKGHDKIYEILRGV